MRIRVCIHMKHIYIYIYMCVCVYIFTYVVYSTINAKCMHTLLYSVLLCAQARRSGGVPCSAGELGVEMQLLWFRVEASRLWIRWVLYYKGEKLAAGFKVKGFQGRLLERSGVPSRRSCKQPPPPDCVTRAWFFESPLTRNTPYTTTLTPYTSRSILQLRSRELFLPTSSTLNPLFLFAPRGS